MRISFHIIFQLNGKLNALTKEVDNLRTLLAEKDKIVSNYEKKLNELEWYFFMSIADFLAYLTVLIPRKIL